MRQCWPLTYAILYTIADTHSLPPDKRPPPCTTGQHQPRFQTFAATADDHAKCLPSICTPEAFCERSEHADRWYSAACVVDQITADAALPISAVNRLMPSLSPLLQPDPQPGPECSDARFHRSRAHHRSAAREISSSWNNSCCLTYASSPLCESSSSNHAATSWK